MSHPTWVRGLKLTYIVNLRNRIESHPTWVRGLKLSKSWHRLASYEVAPYVGAWIETISIS